LVDGGDAAASAGARGGAADAGGVGVTLAPADGPALRELPAVLHAQVRGDAAVFVRVGDEPPRWLAISPADGPTPVSAGYTAGDRQTWLRHDIAAGQPQVYAATSEEFVAQMLNLDVLNAIAFDKGCYTGQEVIARAHYRGRVKRRMQRFISRDAHSLVPGDSGQLADGRAFKVVLATQLADGRCDFLAVAPLLSSTNEDAASAPMPPAATPSAPPAATHSATAAVAPSAPHAAPSSPAPATLTADPVSLPYALPD